MKTIVTQIPSRRAFLRGDGTLEIGYPWLTYGAIIALEAIVNKDLKVLEFGSGGSTVFWATNCQSVKSYETNKDWLENVKKRIEGFSNVELILADGQGILEAVSKEPDQGYDIVLIDSYPKDIERKKLAYIALSKVKSNGWFVIDNYQNFGMESFAYPANSEIYTFDEFRYSGHGTRICKII